MDLGPTQVRSNGDGIGPWASLPQAHSCLFQWGPAPHPAGLAGPGVWGGEAKRNPTRYQLPLPSLASPLSSPLAMTRASPFPLRIQATAASTARHRHDQASTPRARVLSLVTPPRRSDSTALAFLGFRCDTAAAAAPGPSGEERTGQRSGKKKKKKNTREWTRRGGGGATAAAAAAAAAAQPPPAPAAAPPTGGRGRWRDRPRRG